MQVLAPCPGHVIPITEVGDPTFAGQIVGPGVGINPPPGYAEVVAPADGMLLKVDPHAFILLVDGEVGILVHIGINTVRLQGRGFEVLVAKGATVKAGSPIVAWVPGDIDDPEISTTVVVVAMDHAPDSITPLANGTDVVAGDPIFTV